MVHRFVFTIKLNIDVNSAGHLNFVLMEEENQVVRTVAAEITVNTTNRKPSVFFVVVVKYVLTTDRNPSVFFVVAVKYVLTTDRNHHVKNV